MCLEMSRGVGGKDNKPSSEFRGRGPTCSFNGPMARRAQGGLRKDRQSHRLPPEDRQQNRTVTG